MKKLSEVQANVIKVLSDGGRIFLFDEGDVGLDDCDGNTLYFRGSTFDVLIRSKLIEIMERPAIGCEIYGLSKLGKQLTPTSSIKESNHAK